MIWNPTNLIKSSLLRKGLALCFAFSLAVSSARGELTSDQMTDAFYRALVSWGEHISYDGFFPSTIPLDDDLVPLYEYINSGLFDGAGYGQGGTAWLQDVYYFLSHATFTNDLGQVVNGLDVLTNQLSRVSSNTDFVGSSDFEWYMDQIFNGVWMAYNQVSYWDHDAASSGAADVYVQNFDELVWELESNINYGMQDALNQSDVLNGTTSFKETGPSYTNSQDTIEARYKYGGQSISNAVGTLGGFDSLDGLLEPLAGVSQSVEIDDLDELDLPEGDSVITLWTDLTILGTEIDDCTIDVGEVLDADLRSILRSMLSVVYSIGCGFLLFRRGLREYKYYASLGSTEGVAE